MSGSNERMDFLQATPEDIYKTFKKRLECRPDTKWFNWLCEFGWLTWLLCASRFVWLRWSRALLFVWLIPLYDHIEQIDESKIEELLPLYLWCLILSAVTLCVFIIWTNALGVNYRVPAKRCVEKTLRQYGVRNQIQVLDWLKENTHSMGNRFLVAVQDPCWKRPLFVSLIFTAVLAGCFALALNVDVINEFLKSPDPPPLDDYVGHLMLLVIEIITIYFVLFYIPLTLMRLKTVTTVLFENALNDLRLQYLILEQNGGPCEMN